MASGQSSCVQEFIYLVKWLDTFFIMYVMADKERAFIDDYEG